MCLEGDLAWSKDRSAEGPWLDRAGAPSLVREGSPMVGTKSSRREVAASSLRNMVSAKFAGRVEGILRQVCW